MCKIFRIIYKTVRPFSIVGYPALGMIDIILSLFADILRLLAYFSRCMGPDKQLNPYASTKSELLTILTIFLPEIPFLVKPSGVIANCVRIKALLSLFFI